MKTRRELLVDEANVYGAELQRAVVEAIIAASDGTAEEISAADDRVIRACSKFGARLLMLATEVSLDSTMPRQYVRRDDGTTPVVAEAATYTAPEDDGETWSPHPAIPLPVKGGD